MESIIAEVDQKQAVDNTKFHCLYDFFWLGLKVPALAVIYKKNETTVRRWIKQFENTGTVCRKAREEVYIKFTKDQRAWLVALYNEQPILYLREAADRFYNEFQETISASHVSVILREAGLTWKGIERRAIQIQLHDIFRFCEDLARFFWMFENLIFLDEVSFDNRAMLRKNGYAVKGSKLIYRGEFRRGPRVSLLCFLGVTGIANCYITEGTFNRLKFAEYCRKFALDSDSTVKQYPGRHSVWILDGAKIHCDSYLISYLRSLGIIPIFLPAYCPFYNPIEVVFGLVKKELQSVYVENSKKDIKITIAEVFNKFTTRNMAAIFQNCGYLPGGRFDFTIGLKQDVADYGF